MRPAFDQLAAGPFDLLVVGGGITGSGVALDAALRGLRVALVEKGDFASGTSSASSKLVHGGLRYLEQGHLGLVYEALAEQKLLLRNAPHLVRPLRFVLPYYRGSRLPAWKGRLGLALYDLLAGRDDLPASRRLTPGRLLREFPALRGDGLLGGSDYYDAQMDDARLGLAVVRTAWRAGAVVANYAEVTAFDTTAGRVTAAEVRDRVTGRAVAVRARLVLNAAGPWADAVDRLAGPTPDRPRLEPTKGVHVVLPGVGLSAAFLLLHPADGRVFFVIPWERRTLLGTTDTFAAEGPDALAVTPAEVAYLLDGYNAFFDRRFWPGDVLGRFAGLRPLVRAGSGGPSDRSREYAVWDGPGGLLSVAGGKYTTYRSMAEAVTDRAAARLGVAARCRTRACRLDGAGPVPPLPGVPADVARHLAARYGSNAGAAAAHVLAEPGGLGPVVPGEPDVRGEWAYQRAAEWALTPADHLLRRSRLGLVRPDAVAAPGPAREAG